MARSKSTTPKVCADCGATLSSNPRAIRCKPCAARFRFGPRTVRICPDCGEPIRHWKAQRCRACSVKVNAVTPLYDGPNVSGLCRCGCGQPTPLATSSVRKYGLVKGQPRHFLTGHHRRLSPVDYVVEDRGYKTPCWIWQLGLSTGGYGQYSIPGGKGKSMPAHQHFYEEKYGPVPPGLELDHLCRVRRCCHPDHVEPVTVAVNNQRGLQAKLTRAQVDEIRVRYAAGGVTQLELADEYGVADAYISQVVNYKTWRN